MQKEIVPITLDMDAVVPLGLITNELITNALKHAFTDKEQGLLKVELFEQKDDLILIVQDDGIGMSEDFFTSKTTSFGHKLIQAFVRNLHAEINVSSKAGTRVELIVRKYQKAS